LINKDGRVKISDFNLALKLENTHYSSMSARDIIGTPSFMAPEIQYVSFLYRLYPTYHIHTYFFQGQGCSVKSDIFSAGLVTLYISRKGLKTFKINVYGDLDKEIVGSMYANQYLGIFPFDPGTKT
jgi:serine/threonine protein kinase